MKKRIVRWSLLALGFGVFVLGIWLDVPGPQQSIFSLVHDMRHAMVVVDHGVTSQPMLPVLMNFMFPGTIRTVADALRVSNIPLTTHQAQIIALCKPFGGATVVIPPDPYQYGVASWYGEEFHGQLAASGEVYDMYAMTAAHQTLPLGSLVRVVSQRSRNSVVVRINDRGPYAGGRIIDLSYRAKEMLGMGDLSAVYLERLNPTALSLCE